MLRNYIFILLLTGLVSSVPVQAQVTNETKESLAVALKENATISRNPGAHLIPGTSPNPLASPDSLPGKAKVLLQPREKMSMHFDHTMDDDASFSMTLIDLLEYRPRGSDSDVHWDIERWQGKDYRRWWFKTEGKRSVHSNQFEANFELLKSKLTHPYTEFQYGLSLQTRGHNGTYIARPQATIGLESVMPYNYELSTGFYIDPKGNISASAKAEKDLLITQKLILQPRIEADAALQEVKRFGVGSGLNSVSLGLRLRYEIRREFAPYLGITYDKSFGKTASLVRQQGEDPSQWRFIFGVRMWF